MADSSDVIDVTDDILEDVELDENLETELADMGKGSEDDTDPTDSETAEEEDE